MVERRQNLKYQVGAILAYLRGKEIEQRNRCKGVGIFLVENV